MQANSSPFCSFPSPFLMLVKNIFFIRSNTLILYINMHAYISMLIIQQVLAGFINSTFSLLWVTWKFYLDLWSFKASFDHWIVRNWVFTLRLNYSKYSKKVREKEITRYMDSTHVLWNSGVELFQKAKYSEILHILEIVLKW